jgi:flagellar hook-associated protein 2
MISFTGLASGMDTGAIVDSLVGLERSQSNALKRQKAEAEARSEIIDDLRSKLNALETAAGDLDETDETRSPSATSGDTASIGATASAGAADATYSVKVVSLAQAETTTSKGFATDSLTQNGNLKITVGSDPEISVKFFNGETIQDYADRINDSGARVNAVVINDGDDFRLLITSEETGEDNAISFAGNGVNRLGINEIRAAQDASLEVNGLDVTRSTNTVDDLFPGLTLDLLQPTAGEIEVKVGNDVEAAREKVQGLVDAYNEVASLLDEQLSYNGVAKGADTLFADSTLRGMQRELSSILTETYGASQTSAGFMGLGLGQDGSLTLDAAKFDAAVESDPSLLDDLLTGVGLSEALSDLADKYGDSSQGLLDAKQDAIRDRIDDLDRGIERINRRADQLEIRLSRQFTALETTMAELNSQTSYIMTLFQNLGMGG